MIKSYDPLWFHIDAAMFEIQELCLRGRAAELVAQQLRAEEQAAELLAVGRSIPPPPPSSVQSDAQRRFAGARELARDAAFREANEDGADLVELRENVRRILAELRGKLSEVLSDHEVYYVLFPLVVYVDELVATATRGAVMRWERLQSELYEIENGGELFYQILDERLKQEETHPLVLESFYFCLLDGFTGMYLAGSRKIEEYKAALVAKIPRPEIRFPLTPARRVKPELVPFPWRYYVVAAATVVLTYVILTVMANEVVRAGFLAKGGG
jgi:type IV/VI secretion system ImpK/VasF family protein